jgi:hypothetical protein
VRNAEHLVNSPFYRQRAPRDLSGSLEPIQNRYF